MNVQIENSGTPLEVEILELLEVISPVSFSDMRSFVISQVEESIKKGYSMADLKAFVILEPVNERIVNKNMSFFSVKVVNPWASVSREYKENPYFAFSFTKEKNQAVEKYKLKRKQLNKIILGSPSSTDGFFDIELNPKIVPEKDTFSPPVSIKEYMDSMVGVAGVLGDKKVIFGETAKPFDSNEYWNKEGEKEPLKDNTEKIYIEKHKEKREI